MAETLYAASIVTVTQDRSIKSTDTDARRSTGVTGTLIAEEHAQKMIHATNP
jgi:hypothetical protein